MKPTLRERIYAGGIMFAALWALLVLLSVLVEDGSPASKRLPMFVYSFVGLILAAAYRPRPFLDLIRKITRGWPRLP